MKAQILKRLELIQAGQPKRSLGQNFLISELVVDRILQAAFRAADRVGLGCELIEIGPGPGSLTDSILQFAEGQDASDSVRGAASSAARDARPKRKLTLIEMDQAFAAYWRTRTESVIEGDALQIDWSQFSAPTVLISNLPYQISSSIVIDRSVERYGIQAMVLMFQKEVAQRIAARPKTSDFGLLSVIAQLVWTIEKVTEAGPRDFWPAPKVASRVLQFRLRADAPGEDEMRQVLKVAKAAYGHRRKQLISNLEGLGVPRARVERVFAGMKLASTVRAEELSAEEMRRLSSEIFEESR